MRIFELDKKEMYDKLLRVAKTSDFDDFSGKLQVEIISKLGMVTVTNRDVQVATGIVRRRRGKLEMKVILFRSKNNESKLSSDILTGLVLKVEKHKNTNKYEIVLPKKEKVFIRGVTKKTAGIEVEYKNNTEHVGLPKYWDSGKVYLIPFYYNEEVVDFLVLTLTILYNVVRLVEVNLRTGEIKVINPFDDNNIPPIGSFKLTFYDKSKNEFLMYKGDAVMVSTPSKAFTVNISNNVGTRLVPLNNDGLVAHIRSFDLYVLNTFHRRLVNDSDYYSLIRNLYTLLFLFGDEYYTDDFKPTDSELIILPVYLFYPMKNRIQGSMMEGLEVALMDVLVEESKRFVEKHKRNVIPPYYALFYQDHPLRCFKTNSNVLSITNDVGLRIKNPLTMIPPRDILSEIVVHMKPMRS